MVGPGGAPHLEAGANSSHSFMKEQLVGTAMRASRKSSLTLVVAIVLSAVMASPFVAVLTALPGEGATFSSSGSALSGHVQVQPAARLAPLPQLGVASSTPVRPLIPVPETVNVTEGGLPAGTSWSAAIDGAPAVSGVGRTLQFSELSGTHQLVITPIQGYLAGPPFESFTVVSTGVNLTITFTPGAASPFATGMPASLAIGQPNLTGTGSGAANQSNLFPWLSAFDSHGDLWVSDLDANRVVEFVPPFHTGMKASLVIGQSNFTNFGSGFNASNLTRPEGVAFDSAGDLWVASEGAGRVTEFRPPFSNGMNASVIIGQAGFGVAPVTGFGPTNLTAPVGISFDASGDLWVADFLANRVTEYRPPFTNGEGATLVLGQSTLTGHLADTTAVNLTQPQAIQFDSHGDAWVGDWGNGRALEYMAPLSTGEAASVVLGEPDFTTALAGGLNNLSNVGTLLLDSHGNLWVADFENNRIVEYLGPTFANDEAPAVVIGQPNMTADSTEGGPVGISEPQGAVFDSSGNLWVDDIGDHRVLEFIALALPSTSSSSSNPNLIWIILVIVVAVIAVVEAVMLMRRPSKPSSGPGGPTQWSPSASAGSASPPPPPPPSPPASPPSVPPGAA
jgi:sugar lactone lactonase YvrE